MADIDIQCPECKTVTSVSEFVDTPSIACKSCGHRLEPARTASDAESDPKLQLKNRRRDSSPPSEEQGPKGYLASMRPPPPHRRRGPWRVSQHIAAWVLFAALAGAMGYLRYGDVSATRHLEIMQQYGPLVVTAFHILVVLTAFQDSVFQGILCLLIPFYSFIYLFFVNDDFYARAVVAGLLVGIAQDSYFFFQTKVIVIYHAINAWLQSGG